MGVKKISEKEERQLVQEYRDGASVKSLMRKYGFATKKSITDKVKKYNSNYKEVIAQARQNRKSYSIDLSYINSEFNAYFIGLMLTDGYIQGKHKFGIDLIDEDCISFIGEVTGNNHQTIYPKKENHQIKYRIIFSDNRQVENLKRLGVVENKTYTLQPPKLYKEEEKYLPYIIRGIIDGDGCVYQTTKGSAAMSDRKSVV